MEIRLEGDVAVITGAANGIGRGVALAMADAGASVALIDRDAEALERTADEIAAAGWRVASEVVDVADAEGLADAVTRMAADLGDPTVLVTAAAIDASTPLTDMEPTEWRAMLDVNLSGTFYSLRAVLPGMKRRGSGRVVFIGSNIGLKGGADIAHYGASKAGVHGLARCAAVDLAPLGITVNAVAPGPVDTAMLRSLPPDWLEAKKDELLVGRFGTVAEIVPTVLLVASSAGAFFTGSTINISGGDVLQ